MGIFFSSTSSSDKIRRQEELDRISGLNTQQFVKELKDMVSQFIISGDFQNYFKSTGTAKNQCNKILLLLEQLSGGDFYKINEFYRTIGTIDNINRLTENESKKQFICSQIMAYYRKVYDIYQAIEKVFNLTGIDKRDNKERNILAFNTKSNIEHAEFKLFNNLCQQRIDVLNNIFTKNFSGRTRSNQLDFQEDNKKKLCNLSKSLSKNTGINYMETLYNDVYNLNSKKFEKKSENIQKIYNQDLKKFENEMLKISQKDTSQQVRNFSDITIGKLPENIFCGKKMDDIPIDVNDSNYTDFEERVRKMESNYHYYLRELNDILHTLFTRSKGKYVLNPNLKKIDVDKLGDRTSLTIQNMYVRCEFDYIKSLKKLEAIVETGQARRNMAYAG
jgi:hypothetical protein